MENLANKICQPTKAELLSQLEPILTYIQQEAPLIHCITNPISINDCANILLAIGARPIMAEHPDEVAEITAIAKGLALNLGNITDARMASMKISAGVAWWDYLAASFVKNMPKNCCRLLFLILSRGIFLSLEPCWACLQLPVWV